MSNCGGSGARCRGRATGDEAAAPLPLANTLRDYYLKAIARGEAERDWSAVSDSAKWNAGLR
jgi:3-hydroxyisobutyrate dehydrogenase-like beta-hydroxyacid dehydrogenase